MKISTRGVYNSLLGVLIFSGVFAYAEWIGPALRGAYGDSARTIGVIFLVIYTFGIYFLSIMKDRARTAMKSHPSDTEADGESRPSSAFGGDPWQNKPKVGNGGNVSGEDQSP